MPRLLRSLILCVAIAAPLSAQRRAPQPDSIPRALVEALLRPYFGSYPGSTEFFVGKVPPELAPYLYVPKDARVIGGMASQQSTSTVLIVPSSMEQIVAEFGRELPKLGWTPPSDDFGRAWGFVPARTANMSGNGLEFCHIGQSLQIVPVPLPEGGSQVTVTVQNYGGRCNARALAAARPVQATPSSLPTLVNPLGVNMSPQACAVPFSPVLGPSSTSERVQMSMAPDALVAAFAKQLSDSGWTAGGTTAVVRRTWTRPDTAGITRELTVTATPTGPQGCYDVSMSVRQLVGPRR